MKATIRYVLIGAVLGVAAFGVSLRVGRNASPGEVWITLPSLQPAFDVLRAKEIGGRPVVFAAPRDGLILSGPRRVSAAQDNWLFVRQSATWANSNSNMADRLIMSLKNTGLLGNTGSFQGTTVINGVTYKLKLQTNCAGAIAQCQNRSASAYTGTKTYDHRVKFWRASDDLAVLEMLFDDVNTPATGDGVLLVYRLGVLDSTLSDNASLIVESYISGGSPSRRQTYSWGAAFWTSGPNAATASDRGRVVLEEMTIGQSGGGLTPGLCVKIAARTVAFDSACTPGTTASNHYYTLAYGQKTTGGLETTALSGLDDGAMPPAGNSTICGADILKRGIFNGGGFVNDNLTAGQIPAGYPEPGTAVAGYGGVDALFGEVGTAGAGTDGFDDLQQAKLDALNGIAFPNSDAPGF